MARPARPRARDNRRRIKQTGRSRSNLSKRVDVDTVLDLPKLRLREYDIPRKVLLVDDDDLELSLMSDRLTHAGFEVAVTRNGEEALKALDAHWFPIVIADWQMPVMDGIKLVETLRERGDDGYFIMLSVRASGEDFERGYCAGVDDYLSKKSSDTELMARIHAGLNTVALRRSLRQSRAALAVAHAQSSQTSDDNGTQLKTRLNTELARAKRYRRGCSVLMLAVRRDASASAQAMDATIRDDFLHALQGVIRVDIDAIHVYDFDAEHVQFAIVLPETGPAEVAVIRSRIREAVEQRARELSAQAWHVSVGAASVDPAQVRSELTADELLTAAEHCRRCMDSCGARRLTAVQTSVMNQVAIPCRFGYAVADHCLELDHRYAAERDHRAASPAADKEAAA